MVNNVDKYLVSDFIADFLYKKNIDTVFGIIGSANAYIFDSIVKKGYTKIVYMHHEQAAVMAAGAYYRTNNKLSAAIVTAGAGASNAITGVLSNWADSIPCLILSGQEATKYIQSHSNLRMLGTQGFKAADMVTDIVKYSDTIMDKNQIQYYLEKAYYKSLNGRPGPSWLDIPFDIQSSTLDPLNLSHYEPKKLSKNNLKIDKLLELINKAKRPVFLAGHGVKLSKSENEFKTLINNLKIPTLLSWSGIDLLPYNHPFNFGTSGLYGQRCANFVVQNCDLLIVLGSRLSLPQTGYNIDNFAPDAKIVMINNDKKELKKYARYDLTIQSDCKLFINELSLQNINLNIDDWYDQCKSYKNQFPLIEEQHLLDNKKYDNSYVFINNLSKHLKENDVIVIGQGTPLPCSHQALELKSNQIAFASNGLGEMGNGLPSAIGACFAHKGNTILLDGDGSMMMNLQELQTVVGYKLPLKIIIFNNEGYLFIKHTQKMLFQGRYTGVNEDTGVSLPKFSKIATAFDLGYFNSKSNNIQEFLDYNGAAIFECFMNPEQDLVPKVKGIAVVDGILPSPLEEMSPLLDINDIEKNMIVGVNKLSYEIRK
jgi:acetolactate synthase I/II/III large subunit